MPISETQLKKRSEAIGSSDVAAIMGLSKWRTPMDVWLEKTGQLEPETEKARNAPQLVAGNMFENGVLDWLRTEVPGDMYRNKTLRHTSAPLVCNIDAMLVPPGGDLDDALPVEAKTAGLLWEWGDAVEEWGDPLTDEIPTQYFVQACAHLAVMPQAELCHVAAFIAGRGFVRYEIPRDSRVNEAIEAIVDISINFWERHVKTRTPPTGSLASMDSYKRIVRHETPTVAMDAKIVAEWEVIREARLSLEKAEALMQRRVLDQLGQATFGEAEGVGVVSYKPQKRTDIDRDAMRADGVFEEYRRVGTQRVLRLKKTKE